MQLGLAKVLYNYRKLRNSNDCFFPEGPYLRFFVVFSFSVLFRFRMRVTLQSHNHLC